MFFFMKRNISFHENNSVKADYRLKKDGRSGEELSFPVFTVTVSVL